jgi:1-acyl-sn-glycerol-3-phosphate acyltransferase
MLAPDARSRRDICPPSSRACETRTVADLRDHLPGLEPERQVTDWGRSERAESLADRMVYEFLYHYWFRVEVHGVEHLPARGGALLVANRAGLVPFDGAMVARAVRQELSHSRSVHLTSRQTFSAVPGLGTLLTKLGVVHAHPANLHRLLYDERELVLAFPEGGAGAQKPIRERYQLREFVESQFLAAAISTGVPIVPVAVLGSEEAVPVMARLAARLPVIPLLPLPSKFVIRFLAPVRPPEVPAAPQTERQLAERVRGLIQDSLYEMLSHRRSAWFSGSAPQ